MCLVPPDCPAACFCYMYWHFVHSLTLCVLKVNRQQTAVIDYTRLAVSAVIHTHAVMCLVPRALQPVSVHVLALHSAITLCMHR
jgi:hypothetical protein